MTVPNFAYTSGNPDNLVGGNPASMTDMQGPLFDLRAYINDVVKPVLDTITPEGFLPGDLKFTARATALPGWLICNGSNVLRATYPDLFDAIGTAYGAGDGSTTFGLPDLRGRVPVGVDGGAGRLTANGALGNSGGEEQHILSVAEMPRHNHSTFEGAFVEQVSSGGFAFLQTTGTYQITTQTGTNFTGSSNPPHNNMQPFQVGNWMVKT